MSGRASGLENPCLNSLWQILCQARPTLLCCNINPCPTQQKKKCLCMLVRILFIMIYFVSFTFFFFFFCLNREINLQEICIANRTPLLKLKQTKKCLYLWCGMLINFRKNLWKNKIISLADTFQYKKKQNLFWTGQKWSIDEVPLVYNNFSLLSVPCWNGEASYMRVGHICHQILYIPRDECQSGNQLQRIYK